jgi:hypothetical protein
MAAGLKHVYHGELADCVVRYVPTSPLPAGLSGRVLFTSFPYEAVFDTTTARLANPHMLTAPGRLFSIDLDADSDGGHVLATRFLDVYSRCWSADERPRSAPGGRGPPGWQSERTGERKCTEMKPSSPARRRPELRTRLLPEPEDDDFPGRCAQSRGARRLRA